jgi:light-regulated signal transduction histidine kinase (bacteriophytochrome)
MTQSRIVVTELDMDSIVGSVLLDLLPDEENCGFELRIHPMPAAWGDEILVRQVWFNLISNAVKYSMKSAIRRIEIGADLVDAQAVYYVKDSGAGFDPELAHAPA